jgi:hypothetical protein
MLKKLLLLSLAQILEQSSALAQSSDIQDPVILYHAGRLYDPASEKAAYVKLQVLGKCMELDCEAKPTDAHIQQEMQRAYNDAVVFVDGVDYTGGSAVALSKATVGAAKIALQNSKNPRALAASIFLDDKVAGKLIDKGAELLSTPPQDPKLNYDIVLYANIHGTRVARAGQSPMSKFMNDADTKYNKRNPNVPLEMEPTVQEALRFFSLKNTIEEGRRDAKENKNELMKRMSHLEEKTTKGISDATDSLNQVLGYLDRKEQAEFRKQELARQRAEVTGVFGFAGGLARLGGDAQAAETMDRFGSFTGNLFDTLTSSIDFERNPAAFANQYVMLFNMGMSLFAQNKPDPRWEKLFSAIQSLQRQIQALGERMDARFDRLEARLASFVKDATERFNDLQVAAKNLEASNRFVEGALSVIQQDTYGHFVFDARLGWVDLENKCLQRGISLAQFLDCRDKMAVFGVESPPMTSRSSFDRNIVSRLAQRMESRGIYAGDTSKLKDPAAWLSSVDSLLEMVALNPNLSSAINERSPASAKDPELSLKAVIDQGKYFSLLTNQMALKASGETFELRRDLVEDVFNGYLDAVRGAVNHIQGLPNRYLQGVPNPKIALEEQEPTTDPSIYAALTLAPIQVCDDLDNQQGQFAQHFTFAEYVGHTLSISQMRSQASAKGFAKLDPSEYQLGPAFIPLLPKILRFALTTTGFRDQTHLSITPCFREVHLGRLKETEWLSLGQLGSVNHPVKDNVEISLSLEIRAHWFSGTEEKRLTIFRMSGSHLWDGGFADFWIPTVWRGGGAYPGIARDPKDFFDPNTPQGDYAKNLATLANDFKQELSAVSDLVENDISSGQRIKDSNSESQERIKELSFIVERGLDTSIPSVFAVSSFLSGPTNLPKPSEWAGVQWRNGLSRDYVLSLLDKRRQAFKTLVDAVEAEKGLRPGGDLFGPAVADLETLRAGNFHRLSVNKGNVQRH